MGLFRKNPAEKKLKELTGGFILSTEFINRLKSEGLEINDGTLIQRQLKEEIKDGLDEKDIRVRLNVLIREAKKEKYPEQFKSKTCPECGQKQEEDNSFCINCGFDFNKRKAHRGYTKSTVKHKVSTGSGYNSNTKDLPKHTKTCPVCNTKHGATRHTCSSCGNDLTQVDYDYAPDLSTCPHCNRKVPKDLLICPFCKFSTSKSEKERLDKKKRKEELLEKQKLEKENLKSNCLQKEKSTKDLKLIDFKNSVSFKASFDHNLKICPECSTKIIKEDPFCFNCGATVVDNDTVKNDNLEVRDGKLVKKQEDSKNSELSDLEALYSQTVQSKYAPSFRIAYVMYLEQFRKNPAKKFSDKTAKKYDTTVNKLKKQALEDGFVELAPAINEAYSLKVTEIKEILKQNNLKVSGKKDELIERLSENLSDDELKKYFKAKNYQISEEGLEFLQNNSYILYIYSNSDISAAFYPSEIGKIFEEKIYTTEEIHEKLIDYLKKILDEKLTQERWIDYKLYSNAICEVLEDSGDLKESLNIRMKVFLFDINNYSVALNKPEPARCKLKKKDMVKIVNVMHKLTLPIDEVKDMFEKSYGEILFKSDISQNDALIYLLKVFGGEDLESISSEIRQRYSNLY